MKYLDYPELESLSRALTFESAECKVFTRIEAYSCKAVKRERQLFKSLESQYLHSASLSPPNHVDEALASPFGRLDQAQARKTLFLLIATLNGAFPDHDFSGVDPADFRREISPDSVLNSLGTTLLSLRSNSNAPRSFSSFPSSYDDEERGMHASGQGRTHSSTSSGAINHPQLAAVLDDIMSIADCEVFTFHPDADSDPHASAEPDEEGDGMDDERYADDEGWSGDEEDDGQDTRMSTPQRQHAGSFDESMGDTPMFDEDLLGFGFTPVHSRVSSTVTTPRTPSSARSRAGDFFSVKRQGASSKLPFAIASSAPGAMAQTLSARMPFGSSHSSGYSDEEVDNDYDDSTGLHGLLWATYAFFYNRKLKRILFVSVWSRRNNKGPTTYSFSPPSYPSVTRVPESIVPPLSIDQAITSGQSTATQQQEGKDVSSPAKRAIAKSTGVTKIRRASGTKRGRDLSASPAPSSRSPFPHDSPKGQSEALQAAAETQRDGRLRSRALAKSATTASPLRITSQTSGPPQLDGRTSASTHASRSAPASKSAGAMPGGYIGAPPVVASSLSSSTSSKRAGEHTPVNAGGANEAGVHHHSLDQSARKHRKVHALHS